MEINYWAVLACGVWSMVIGMVWYGPIFGKAWSRIIKADAKTLEERKAMQKRAAPLYLVTFILSLFQAYVLAHYIAGWQDASGMENAIWIWAAFLIPTVAAGAMWNNDAKEVSWARFGIQASYYLVLFIGYGLILGMWR